MDQPVLGIDRGTGSSKAVLVTASGEVVATATRSHGTSMPYPGWVEVDADAVWWDDVASLSRELVDRAG